MSENTRTIEIPLTEKLSFAYRADKDVLKANAVNVEVTVDLSKLTPEDLMEWAYSAMIVSFQSKLRSKNPAKAEEDGSYKWAVPSRGTRSIADPAKLVEAGKKLVGKMGPEQKYHLMIQMGVTEEVAAVATGFTPTPTAA